MSTLRRWLATSLVVVFVILSMVTLAVGLIQDDATYESLREWAHWIRR